MNTFTETPDPSEERAVDAPVDLAPPSVSAAVPASSPVDNSGEPAPVDNPMQELPDDQLPREIGVGAMGAERALLMQLLGLDVNHPFDADVEDEIRRHAPDYAGTVTKAVWRELYAENVLR